jgi:hypothetical protein
MKKQFASLSNPGLYLFIIVMAYVILSFFTIGSKIEFLRIPLVTWLIGGGSAVGVGLCYAAIPILRKWEQE